VDLNCGLSLVCNKCAFLPSSAIFVQWIEIEVGGAEGEDKECKWGIYKGINQKDE
jgi:hypothetical protein